MTTTIDNIMIITTDDNTQWQQPLITTSSRAAASIEEMVASRWKLNNNLHFGFKPARKKTYKKTSNEK